VGEGVRGGDFPAKSSGGLAESILEGLFMKYTGAIGGVLNPASRGSEKKKQADRIHASLNC